MIPEPLPGIHKKDGVEQDMDQQKIRQTILDWGAYRVGFVAVKDIQFEREFRNMCASNACGMYGRSWMCPPCVGEIEDLIAQAKTYRWAMVYQTVNDLEDSYDIEGMLEAGKQMNRLTERIRENLDFGPDALTLGAGGCRICPVCAKVKNEPCRFPEKAISSLEAYGVNVSRLAELADMKYINGQDTVTYFGTVFYGKEG